MAESSYLVWFRRLMWLGIIANVALALVSITRTDLVLELLGLPAAAPLVWPRFASFLLILLSGFYVPAAIDPKGNRFSAIFAVVCRFGGVGFFSLVGGRYIVFGLFDLFFGLPQAILLALASASSRKTRDAGGVK